MSAAFDGLYALGRRALRLMALALDLPPTWFLDRFKKPILNMRPLHYSATLSKPDEVSNTATHVTAARTSVVNQCG